jgi:hypothetical protein
MSLSNHLSANYSVYSIGAFSPRRQTTVRRRQNHRQKMFVQCLYARLKVTAPGAAGPRTHAHDCVILLVIPTLLE